MKLFGSNLSIRDIVIIGVILVFLVGSVIYHSQLMSMDVTPSGFPCSICHGSVPS